MEIVFYSISFVWKTIDVLVNKYEWRCVFPLTLFVGSKYYWIDDGLGSILDSRLYLYYAVFSWMLHVKFYESVWPIPFFFCDVSLPSSRKFLNSLYCWSLSGLWYRLSACFNWDGLKVDLMFLKKKFRNCIS